MYVCMYIYILELRKFNGVTEEDTRGLLDFQHDGIQYFSLSQLEKATDNFCLENKIGEGGFGVVYLVNCIFLLEICTITMGTSYLQLLEQEQ
mgnify:CR=1 FL=1